MGDRLTKAREAANYRSARAAALRFGWPESTYRSHETGGRDYDYETAKTYGRAFRVDPVWLLLGVEKAGKSAIPIMGLIGAGSVIEPDFEQVPPEGLDEVELPIPVSDQMIGFEIRGDSMLPRYGNGDVVVCWRDRGVSIDSFVPAELAVRTTQGRRYLKDVHPTNRKNVFDLLSWNAQPLKNVRIEWFSPIYVTVRADQVRRMTREAAARPVGRALRR